MTAVVERALRHWGLEGAAYHLVAARENAVYRVSHMGRDIALRLHREHYRSDAELLSELDWMAEMSRGGLAVPAPIPDRNGAVLVRVGPIQVDALTWLPGETMTDALGQLTPADRALLLSRLGSEMARLHDLSDAWRKPDGFDRVHWDQMGLLGDAPLWGRFWDNPELSPADRNLFLAFRDAASRALAEDGHDYGLIHADLVPDNVLVAGEALTLIDFDDGGFGFRLFDVATALLKHASAKDYPDLQGALIEGYRTRRSLDIADLGLFLALRAVTYVGWNITRMQEDGGIARNGRFIEAARRHVLDYMTL